MAASVFSSQCGGNRMSQQEQARQQNAVALVGDVPVLGEAIQSQASKISASDTSLAGQSSGLMYATGTVLRAAAIRSILLQGSAVSDAEVTQAIEKAADGQIEQMKGQLMMQGKIKPGASDAEIDKAIKSLGSTRTIAQIRGELVTTLTTAYKDPARKDAVIEGLGDAILTARLGEKAVGDDQTLRESYKTYVVKRIFFSAQSGAKETPEQRADKALADLKGGKSFEKLMDELSNDPAPPGGKPLHELTQTLPTDALSRVPELASLKGKPIGTTTGAVDVPGGKAIYQLTAIQDQVPPDFDKNKQKYRSQKADEAGRAELERQVQALLASDAVKWQHLGFKAFAAAYKAMSSPTGPSEDLLRKALADAEAATKSQNDSEKQVGARAMLAISSMLKTVPGADPAKMKSLQLSALEAVQAAGLQDAATSLQLADLYAEAKDGAKATDALLAASKSNTRYDAEGERLFREVAGKAIKLEAAKVITKEQHQSIEAQQAAWTATKAENAKAEAQAKEELAKQQKANEAEIARQKAEAAKASTTTGGGTTTGAPALGGGSLSGGALSGGALGGGTTGVPGTSTAPPGPTTTGSGKP
jgi:hypothetical protein